MSLHKQRGYPNNLLDRLSHSRNKQDYGSTINLKEGLLFDKSFDDRDLTLGSLYIEIHITAHLLSSINRNHRDMVGQRT